MNWTQISAATLILTLASAFTSIRAQAHTFVTSNGTKVHYDKLGRGHQTILFLHGGLCNSTHWQDQAREISKQANVILLDLQGHGESQASAQDMSVPALARTTSELITRLNLENVVIVGHSLGGLVAVETAQQSSRVKGIVAVDSLLDLDYSFAKSFAERLKQDRNEALKALADSMFLDSSPLKKQILQDFLNTSPETALGLFRTLATYSPRMALSKTRIPIQVINSSMAETDDVLLRKLAPQIQIKKVAGVGHFLMLEKPKFFTSLLKETLSELGSPSLSCKSYFASTSY